MNIIFEVTISDMSDGTDPSIVADDLERVVYDMLHGALLDTSTATASYMIEIARVEA